jgi:hypothetical protein
MADDIVIKVDNRSQMMQQFSNALDFGREP